MGMMADDIACKGHHYKLSDVNWLKSNLDLPDFA